MSTKRKPSIGASLLICFGIIAVMLVGIVLYHIPIQVLLLLSIILTAAFSYQYGYSTGEMVDGMRSSFSRAMVAMVIFILIGSIIGAWIHSGTVPALIYYGLNLINPKYFLPLGLIICSITSLSIGTSWGTAGTVGLALMGIGSGLGFPAPVVAGMVISGAFFGDKMSPLSDTCNLASAAAESNIYKHIVGMAYTTVPAYVICFILYAALGFAYATHSNVNIEEVAHIQTVLAGKFNLTPFVLLPTGLLIVLMILKVHPIPAMMCAAFSGTIIDVTCQGSNIGSALAAIYDGYTQATGFKLVDAILIRGGIQSMMGTFSLAFLALCLGGVLEKVGYVGVLIEKAIERVTSDKYMVPLVIGTTFLSNIAMGTNYMSIILNGGAYRKAFDDAGLERRLLSRLLEEGGTQTAALVPWSTAGAFMAGTLGVATFSYTPYSFLNLVNPILSIVLACFGIFVFRTNKQGS
jgi:Na+:H+ antiporter, NhaC family